MFNSLFFHSGGTGRGGGGQGKGQGKGGGTKPGSGPAGSCICPSCGHKMDHKSGERCIDQICPKCGSRMVRE